MLSKTLVSSEIDLEYNRYGRLSPRQREKLENKEVLYHFISISALGIGLVCMLFGLFDTRPSLLERVIGILFAMPFFAFVVRSYRYPYPFPDGVEKIQGVLDDLRETNIPDSGPLYELYVGNDSFTFTDTALAADLVVNKQYTFYYALHRYHKILMAWEQLDKPQPSSFPSHTI